MVLCKVLYISLVGSSFVMFKPLSSKYNLHNFLRKPKTPVIPAVFQGFACSKGPKNISYKRNVSAPYSLAISSGLTTLYFDFDIFSTSRNTLKDISSKLFEDELNFFPLSSIHNSYIKSLSFFNSLSLKYLSRFNSLSL